MVLDSHMHVGDFPYFGVAIDRDGLVATMREHGVDTGMVFHPDNDLVRDIIGRTPGLYGLVWVNPREADAASRLAALLDEPGSRFRGVKLHPLLDGYHPDDPMVHPVMDVLQERRLPVLIHCGHPIFSLPWSIEELVRRYPEVDVILGHMGHGNIVYINASIDVASRNPRVFLETSGMPMHSKIREAVERVGTERVLFGSDAPFHHLTVELAKVRVSGLSDAVTAEVLGGNGRRLFFGSLAPDVVA
jgi:predicted TIM-barrel fold metal-dependent hydrolase